MAKKLQLLRNGVIFGTKALALTGLDTQLKTLAVGEPAIASYTDGDKVGILLGISYGDGKNYQIFEGAKIGEGGNLEIPQEVQDAIKDAVDSIIDGASDGYDTLKEIETLMKAQDTKISGLQSELDKTQSSIGLSEDGSYVPETESNYLNGASSFKDADKKLDAAIKAVENNATKVAAGNGIDVQNADHTATVSVKVDASDQVLTVGENGLLANLSLKYIQRVTGGEPTPAKLQLIGKNSTVITELNVNDFVMDGMLANAALQGDELVLTFNTDSGQEEIRVNLSQYIDVYTAGNGIDVSGKVISVKRDESSESFLSVDKGGVKLSGVQNAINAAKSTIDAYTVNSKAISGNPVLNGADIKLDGYTVSDKSNEELKLAVDDTVNKAFGKLEKAILDNEEVCSKAFDAVADAVGLNKEGMTYIQPTGTNYINGATSVKDADSKLDAAIKSVSDKVTSIEGDKNYVKTVIVNGVTGSTANNTATVTIDGGDIALTDYAKGGDSTDITASDTINAAFGKVENKISTLDGNVLKQVVAGDGISVTAKDANSQTISISEDAVWDCGTYE